MFTQSADGTIPPAYIALTTRSDKRLRVIKAIDPSVSPLLYPVFFPDGDQGWHVKMKKTDGSKLSMREYYSHQLQLRPDSGFLPFNHSNLLSQQYVVDIYTRIEQDRLEFHRQNQHKYQVAKYKTIMDHIHAEAEQLPTSKIGRHIILPSSHHGSPRNMQQHYQDAMAMVAQIGMPDIFLTMTINPKDEDILAAVRKEAGENAKPHFYPHIVARVAYLKFKKMMEEVRKDGKDIA